MKPYRYETCALFQSAAMLQLLLTYATAFLFFDDGGDKAAFESDYIGVLLVVANCACFILLIVFSAIHVRNNSLVAAQGRLRFMRRDGKPGKPVARKDLSRFRGDRYRYDLFLSHVWV